MHAAEKTPHTATPVRTAGAQGAFFRKTAEAAFFGGEQDRGRPSFFSPMQAKLTVSDPDDPYEREADAIAERVMRMEAPPTAGPGMQKEEEVQRSPEEREEEKVSAVGPQLSRLQRMEAEETREGKLQRSIQRLSAPARLHFGGRSSRSNQRTRPRPHPVPRRTGQPFHPPAKRTWTTVHYTPFSKCFERLEGRGSPMPKTARTGMEARFGADFSSVRIHTGTAAEALSTGIGGEACPCK